MSLLPEVRQTELPPRLIPDTEEAAAEFPLLRLRTGARNLEVQVERNHLTLTLPLPHLAGPDVESVGKGQITTQGNDFYLIQRPGICYGIALGKPGEPPQSAARRLYTSLLQASDGLHLHRVWNWVPGINETVDGEENYRAFNAGRQEAFAGKFGGENLQTKLPAASALGIRSDRMAVLFAAGSDEPENFENPEQVPAREYPREYGRVAPSFARGTRVRRTDGGREWFLSGTASIKGHQTLGETFGDQMRLTLDNVGLMRRQMGVPPDAATRWKIFLRHPRDLAMCRRAFAAAFPHDAGNAMILHTEICRACLLVEVEGTFSSPAT